MPDMKNPEADQKEPHEYPALSLAKTKTGGRTAAMGGSLSDLAVMETGRTYRWF